MEKPILTVEKLIDPPKKVFLMYRAVAKLMQENRDVSQLTVGDITKYAGIGKGTAYEYFSAKEELISGALIYDVYQKICALKSKVERCTGFRNKMDCIFDWLLENQDYNQTNWHIAQIYMGKFGSCEAMRGVIPEQVVHEIRTHLKGQIDEFLNGGRQEGVFTESCPVKQQFAFLAAMIEYAMYLTGQSISPIPMTEPRMREFIYESMVKALQ